MISTSPDTVERVFKELKEMCLQAYDEGKTLTVDELMIRMMDHPEVPMHFPYQHFIMPASLLTVAAMEKELPKVRLEAMLSKALVRARKVPGGFCGEFGSCGSGVGTGIFYSVFTNTTPKSEEGWAKANEMTGIALQKIASVNGPRCCKRTGFLALQAAVPFANEKLDLHMSLSEKIICHFADRNQECKKCECPFYQA